MYETSCTIKKIGISLIHIYVLGLILYKILKHNFKLFKNDLIYVCVLLSSGKKDETPFQEVLN